MPEGPEVKTVARTIAHDLIGEKLGSLWHSSLKLRKPVNLDELRKLENHVVDNVSCYGKVLFIEVAKKTAIVVQLGMTGQLTVCPRDNPVLPHTHVRWSLPHSNRELRYVDPRRFGVFDCCDEKKKAAMINRFGPDPFSLSSQDAHIISAAIKKSNRAIKEILLDQSVLVGVGNIYASEALFLSRIHPETAGSSLSSKSLKRLIDAVVEVLNLAYANCGTTFSNYVDGSGTKGKNLEFLKVFQRDSQPCLTCESIIVRIKQGGRSTFFCPRCQK